MPIGLSDRITAKDRENRTRRRYAIHQALSYAGYRAKHPGSIYSLEVCIRQNGTNGKGLEIQTVALEVFEVDRLSRRWYDKKELEIKGESEDSVLFGDSSNCDTVQGEYNNIIVAYVKSSDMKGFPLAHFEKLSLGIQSNLQLPKDFDLRVIGPVDSGQVFKELKNLNTKSQDFLQIDDDSCHEPFLWLINHKMSNKGANLPDFRQDGKSYYVFSPFATSDFETLLGQRSGGMKGGMHFVPSETLPYGTNIDRLAVARDLVERFTGARYIRTIHNDSTVFEEIAQELKVRGVVSKVDDLGKVALIAESDTRYGRSMPVNFLKGALEALKAKSKKDACGESESEVRLSPQDRDEIFSKRMRELRVFSYISGIDGNRSRAADSIDTSNSPDPNALEFTNTKYPIKESEGWKDPIAHGYHQIDYVRRLADEIKRQSRGDRPIRAIGILGTDVYDKLLLMRALKPLLGEVVFFTTDLDVRLWSSSEVEFTRNLLVGSSYGLGFAPKSLQFVPPLRDSYQASVFMSVLMAVKAIRNPYEIEA